MSGTYEVTEVTKRKGIPAWWVMVFLFWLGWVFMYADRTILNPVMGELEKEFMRFKADLPLNYVRREDYIRGQTVIEAKLDALYNKLEVVQQYRNTGGQ